MDAILLIIPLPDAELPERGYLDDGDEWVPGRACPGCDWPDPANLIRPCCSLEALYRVDHP